MIQFNEDSFKMLTQLLSYLGIKPLSLRLSLVTVCLCIHAAFLSTIRDDSHSHSHNPNSQPQSQPKVP